MADMLTTYDNNGATTTTQSPGVTPGTDDMSFFRDMAMRALAPPKRPSTVKPTGLGKNNAQVMPERERLNHTMLNQQMRAANAQAADARHEAAYKQQLRQFDLEGPRKMNLAGGPQMIGGFVEDRDSIPYSLRGSVNFANTPSDAIGGARTAATGLGTLDRPTFQQFIAANEPDQRADYFGTGTTNTAEQGAVLRNNALLRQQGFQGRR